MCNDRRLDTIFNKTHIETRIERTAALNIEQSTFVRKFHGSAI